MPIPSSHQKEQPGTTQASHVVAVAHASPQVWPPEPEPDPEPDPEPELEPEPEPELDPEPTLEQSENAHWLH
jgi:hypothetical protein